MRAILVVLALAAASGPALAEDRVSNTPVLEGSADKAPVAASDVRSRAIPSSLCSRSDPYIEYRDCVNANTRDANAKVRMA
jgi:hypothetical protein